jgi:hypothetical protein
VDTAIFWFLHTPRRLDDTKFFRERSTTLEWYTADFPISSLGDLILHKHWGENVPKEKGWPAPPRTVREFAAEPRAIEAFKSDKMLASMRGRPIYVATSVDDLWHIAEGSHRTDALWKAKDRETVPVVLGVHPEMLRWHNILRA